MRKFRQILCPQLFSIGVFAIFPVAARADTAAFSYPPPGAILSATLNIDTAALNAHQYVGFTQVNSVELLDPMGIAPAEDLSAPIFGGSTYGGPFGVDQGLMQSGFLSASISPAFFPILSTGEVGLALTLTDTMDAAFAIDTIFLELMTSSGPLIATFENASPPSLANNGFGIGVPDNGLLPGPVSSVLPAGYTFTGFDETIASKSIRRVPEPGTLAALALGLLIGARNFRRASIVRGARLSQRSRGIAAAGLLLVCGTATASAQLVTHADVENFVCDVILGGDCAEVSLWITDTPVDFDYVARDFDDAYPDEPMPYAATWPVMIDDMPTANFGHPVRWVLIDANTLNYVGPMTREFPPSIISLSTGGMRDFGCRTLPRTLPCPPSPPPLPPPPPPGGPDQDCVYAVLISGGINAQNNRPRYAKNLTSMYNKLRACGFPKNRIFMYYTDGTTAIDADGDGNNDVTGGATKAAIRQKLQNLCLQLNPLRDVLFVYTTNHGKKDGGLCLWGNGANAVYTPDEFKTDTRDCRVCRLFVIMDQCYSGQFTGVVGDGRHRTTAIYTAASATEPSVCRQYMAYWEGMNPATNNIGAMHRSVTTSMAPPQKGCYGGANDCEPCTVNAQCPGGECKADSTSTPQSAEGVAGVGRVPLCYCWLYYDRLPDQLHLLPYRTVMASGERAQLLPIVESQFTPLPGQYVTFTRLAGDFIFSEGTVLSGGSQAQVATDIDGVGHAEILAAGPGTAFIGISVDGTELSNYAVIQISASQEWLDGDCNRDGRVDLEDLSLLLASFGLSDACDLNGDQIVDLLDLTIVLGNFGAGR